MKRVALGIVMIVVAIPLFANVTLINLGYNVHAYRNVSDPYFGELDFSRLGTGPVFTFFVGRKNGFYAQLAPFLATGEAVAFTTGRTVYSYRDTALTGGGLNLVLGYGRDINFGKMGILLGAGLFGSGYVLLESYYGEWEPLFLLAAPVGAGAGAHFYFMPGTGRLVLNAGVDLAWRPFKVGDPDWGSYRGGPSIAPNEYNVNLNAGIGFRR